jgi:preprotein translocase subunit SecE
MAKIFEYIRDAKSEAGKVHWPTKKETLQSLTMVLVFTLIAVIFFAAVDFGIIQFVEKVLL